MKKLKEPPESLKVDVYTLMKDKPASKKKIKVPLTEDEEYEKELNKFLTMHLRRISYRWKYRNEAKKLARVGYGEYKCNACASIVGAKDHNMDHVEPVVRISGKTNWDDYARRMLAKTQGFQLLCKPCHSAKTLVESNLRKMFRKSLKENK